MPSVIAILASVLTLSATVWYTYGLLHNHIRPNISSWTVWAFVTILSTSSYFTASDDVIKSLLAFSNSAATIITFIFIIYRGKFALITSSDMAAGFVGIIAGLVWVFTRSAAWGNLVIQFAVVIGGIPTYRSVWRDPTAERPVPWLMWGLSGALAAAVVLLRWTGKPLELAYPLCGLFLYGGIGLLALLRKEIRAVEVQEALAPAGE